MTSPTSNYAVRAVLVDDTFIQQDRLVDRAAADAYWQTMLTHYGSDLKYAEMTHTEPADDSNHVPTVTDLTIGA